jgi:Rrf2 family protein
MELSRVSDYAIRAVLYLTQEKKPCKTIEIAEAMVIPKAYLSKVLQELARRDIVRLKAGVGGGVELIADPAELTVLRIIEAIEGRFAFNRCVYAPGECQLVNKCPLHKFWERAQDLFIENVGMVTFKRLAEDCANDAEQEEMFEKKAEESNKITTKS